MVAENENIEEPTEASRTEGAESSSQSVSDNSESRSANSDVARAENGAPEAQSANSASEAPFTNGATARPLEDKLKKGAKGYLMKIGKLMLMFAILGSLLICFATYMISSTFNNIFNKLEHPVE